MRFAATLSAAAVLTHLVLGSGTVLAADYPLPQAYEPPPEPVDLFNWGGLYGGIHAGYAGTESSGLSTYDAAARSIASSALGLSGVYSPISFDTTNYSSDEGTFGGFVGANWVWDDVILGLEADYITFWDKNQGIGTQNFGVGALPGYGAVVPQGTQTTAVNNVGLLKIRAGYAMGRFLPFATIGLAVAQGTVTNYYGSNSVVTGTAVVPFAGARKQGWLTGGTAGVGLDVALTDNVFVRAEYNYIGFADFNGTSVTMHNLQAGIAFKY
jgi:opacity protein-like surface antigen